jgi:uncharacterized protein
VFSFPEQPLDPDIKPESELIVALNEQHWAFFELDAFDREARTFEVSWNQGMIDQGVIPTSLVHYVNFNERAKLTALCDLADQMLAGDATEVAHAILRKDTARFLPGRGPAGGRFVGDRARPAPARRSPVRM